MASRRFPSPGIVGVALEEAGVIAVGDEADLVTVLLLGDPQAEMARLIAYRGLVQSADRKQGARQLRLIQREEEVGLVLGRIHAALQAIRAAGLAKSTRA